MRHKTSKFSSKQSFYFNSICKCSMQYFKITIYETKGRSNHFEFY
ncbi:unnamed protein product [Brugia timori]|uniref:Uncharacterized protein n=1 Tax=Brugia timori TaxID=42155 RepID=A0A0R3R2P3_9BILA|nr:unnamed protein product [Brugia timori]